MPSKTLYSQIGGLLLMIYYAILSLPIISKLDKFFYSVRPCKMDVPDKNLLPCELSKRLHKDFYHEYLLIHNKIRIHYASIGIVQKDKPLMLFVHGFPECWYSWRHQMIEFAEDYYVVAIDMRGYNMSSRPENRSDYSMDKLVCDIEAVISALSTDKSAILVAHDWGGAVAWTFAHKHPEMVKRLIVMNIPHPNSMMKALKTNEEQVKRSWYIYWFQIPFLPERSFLKNGTKLVADIFKKQFVNKDQISDEDVAVFQEAVARGKGNAIRAMINYYRNVFTLKSFLSGRRMKAPLEVKTLLIWGEKDSALGKETAEDSKRYVKDFTLRFIPNSSHWVQQDTPKEVNAIMQEFLYDLKFPALPEL